MTTRAAPRKLVVLEDAVIMSICQHPAYISHFPFLQKLTPFIKACGRCSEAQRQKNAALAQAKASFATLAPAQQALLKNLLNATTVRVAFPKHGGGHQVREF